MLPVGEGTTRLSVKFYLKNQIGTENGTELKIQSFRPAKQKKVHTNSIDDFSVMPVSARQVLALHTQEIQLEGE